MKLDKSKIWLFRVETEEDGAAVFKHFDCPIDWDVCRRGIAKGLVWSPECHRVFHTPKAESLEEGIWVDVEKLKEALPKEPTILIGNLDEWRFQTEGKHLHLILSEADLPLLSAAGQNVRITIEEL